MNLNLNLNLTLVTSILFLSFTCCMGIVGYLITQGVDGWGWILIASVLFYGSVNIKTTKTAECPDCHRVFEFDSSGKEKK